MADAPKVTVATAVAAAELHPATQVVTAVLHNSLMQGAQKIVDDLWAAYNSAKAIYGAGAIIAFFAGIIVGKLL